MRVGSLFSGIGGFDKGLEMAGMTIAWQAELDPYCSRVLARHWPGVPNLGDVREFTIGYGNAPQLAYMREPYAVDLIAGGFPCQDVSVAGKRAGLDGARSGLWFEFQRILRELRPTWAIIENVPGLLSSNQGRDFATILDGLGECGFGGIAWAVLDSQHFGIAQRRRRVFIVCGPTSRSVEQVLSLCEGCGGDTAPGREARENLAATIRGRSSGAGVNEPGRGGEDDANLVLAHSLRAQANASHRKDNDTYVAYGGNRTSGPLDRAAALQAHGGPNGRQDFGSETFVLRTAQTSSNGWGIDESDTAYTLDGANGQAVAQPLRSNRWGGSDSHGDQGNAVLSQASVRRLTPVECARLQGFPDDWLSEGADGPKYKALGNAVTVPVIEYLGRRIMALSVAPVGATGYDQG